jgi:hypothetical protein
MVYKAEVSAHLHFISKTTGNFSRISMRIRLPYGLGSGIPGFRSTVQLQKDAVSLYRAQGGWIELRREPNSGSNIVMLHDFAAASLINSLLSLFPSVFSATIALWLLRSLPALALLLQYILFQDVLGHCPFILLYRYLPFQAKS